MIACLVLALPLGGQSLRDSLRLLQHENDSLRQRVGVLTAAVREYILAADHYATVARNSEALLSWYRNRPDQCSLNDPP